MAKATIIDGWYIEGKKPTGWEKRGEGSYRLVVSCKGPDGKNIKKTLTYKTTETAPSKIADELNRERAQFMKRIESNSLRTGDDLTFREYVYECWIPQYASVRTNMSVRTEQDSVKALENRIFPYIGSKKINEIKKAHIEAILADMRSEDLKAGTIKRYFAIISGVMSWAYEHEAISDNPCKRIRFRNSDTKEMQVFTSDQVERFLSSLKMTYQKRTTTKEASGDWFESSTIHTMYQVYFTVALTSGLRRGEMCALTWRDVDFDNKEVRITKAISKVNPVKDSEDRMKRSGLMLKDPKNTSSNRTVPLTAASLSLLRKWKAEEKMISYSWGNGKNFEDNFIFVQMDSGLPIYPDSPSGKLKDIINMYNEQKCKNEKEKLPVLHLHELRHTFATQMLINGVSPVVVAKILGHAKVSTTLDIYGNHLDMSAMKEAAEKMDRLFTMAM